MERLTKYLASGAADYNYPAGCYSGNDCNDRVAKSAYRQTCVERLAAYEETGLTPEESKRMSNILMDVGIDYNCSWEYVKNWLLDDRLREDERRGHHPRECDRESESGRGCAAK